MFSLNSKKAFAICSGIALLILIIASLKVGISADDRWQNKYSDDILSYFADGNESALKYDDGLHLYGGLYEGSVGYINKWLGYTSKDIQYHNVRHITNSILGFIAMLFVGLLVARIKDWQWGIFAFLLLFLSPRFFGHSLMNPKDIPFAAGYMVSVYFMYLIFNAKDSFNWKHAVGLGLGIGLAMGVRSGGLLLIAYYGLFSLLFLLTNKFNLDKLKKYFLTGIAALPIVLVLTFLLWPFGRQAPMTNLFNSISQMTSWTVNLKLLFQGDIYWAQSLPWYYISKWMFISIPLTALIGFFAFPITFFRENKLVPKVEKITVVKTVAKTVSKKTTNKTSNKKTKTSNKGPRPAVKKADTKNNTQRDWSKHLSMGLILFTVVFPIVYVVLQGSTLYDGWRQLLFVYPSFVVLSTLGIAGLYNWSKNEKFKYGVLAVSGLLMLNSIFFIVRNPTMSYTFFNPIVGGISGAFGHYETDYWGVSIRNGINWLEDEGKLNLAATDTLVVATNFYYSAGKILAHKGKNVKVNYLKNNERSKQKWDIGLFSGRFIDGDMLKNGKWPHTFASHSVKVNGVPVLGVYEQANDDLYNAKNQKDPSQGNALLKAYLETHPDDEEAWLALANNNLRLRNFDGCKANLQKIFEISPNYVSGLFTQANLASQLQDANTLISTANHIQEIDPENAYAYYFSALGYFIQRNMLAAEEQINKCLKKTSKIPQAKNLQTQIRQMGQSGQ